MDDRCIQLTCSDVWKLSDLSSAQLLKSVQGREVTDKVTRAVVHRISSERSLWYFLVVIERFLLIDSGFLQTMQTVLCLHIKVKTSDRRLPSISQYFQFAHTNSIDYWQLFVAAVFTYKAGQQTRVRFSAE